MEQRREPDALDVVGRQAHLDGDRRGIGRDSLRVPAGVGVLRVDRFRERADGVDEELPVLLRAALLNLMNAALIDALIRLKLSERAAISVAPPTWTVAP